jgi:heterodisulfide reductase subunit A
MYAIKEAVIAKEHAGDDWIARSFSWTCAPTAKISNATTKGPNKQGVRFIYAAKVHTIDPMPDSDDLSIRYVTESGEMQTEVFDMVVLSVGLETSPEVVAMAESLGMELTPGNFCQTDTFAPVTTSRAGVYVCGAFQGPKDIPQAVVDASAAACRRRGTAQFGKEHPDPHGRGRSRNQCGR